MHPRHSDFYIRRVRKDIKDPLAKVMIDAGVPCEVDKFNKDAYVFSFPMKSPDDALTRHDIDPEMQLQMWALMSEHWCEHKPSMTCYIPEDEWPFVGWWIWDNWDIVNGISFLPSADEGHIYEQAPYEDITKQKYKELFAKMPKSIDWNSIVEETDNTIASQEVACTAGVCEI